MCVHSLREKETFKSDVSKIGREIEIKIRYKRTRKY